MAVPTNYAQLIRDFDAAGGADSAPMRAAAAGAASLRLMVSGSMSLPTPTLSRWREITRHTLLERYGMSELGMVLSQPLEGERVEGTVGAPLPSVEVMIAQESGGKAAGAPGEAADVEVHRRDACPGIAMRRSHAISA